ncbi:hypothetical protein ACFY4C_20475 [Actinomadura viridis]|uniref:hypothetical protein n=1 Tax=Actinomadura viridis TaxID=58110 RepID=UPI0036A07D60
MTRRSPEHGTRARYVRGPNEHDQPGPCRCTPCRKANTADQNNTYRLKAYGQWKPYAAAAPVRAHVESLVAQGLKPKRIARLAGVAPPTLARVLHGDPNRNTPPPTRVKTSTAEAILAVRMVLEDLPDAARIDPTGTRRRIQALVTMGWSLTKLAERSGIHRTNFSLLIHATGVRADTARKVRALYDALWDKEPPMGSARDQVSVGKARAWASRQGWASPLAWDDGDLDDPAARPRGVRREAA